MAHRLGAKQGVPRPSSSAAGFLAGAQHLDRSVASITTSDAAISDGNDATDSTPGNTDSDESTNESGSGERSSGSGESGSSDNSSDSGSESESGGGATSHSSGTRSALSALSAAARLSVKEGPGKGSGRGGGAGLGGGAAPGQRRRSHAQMGEVSGAAKSAGMLGRRRIYVRRAGTAPSSTEGPILHEPTLAKVAAATAGVGVDGCSDRGSRALKPEALSPAASSPTAPSPAPRPCAEGCEAMPGSAEAVLADRALGSHPVVSAVQRLDAALAAESSGATQALDGGHSMTAALFRAQYPELFLAVPRRVS